MHLSELVAYAKEHYAVEEAGYDFPGVSLIIKSDTKERLAFLMQQWDEVTGTEIEVCDIRCGQESLAEFPLPYISKPFRMLGIHWIGVKFDDATDPEVVSKLFDRAFNFRNRNGYTFILNNPVPPDGSYYTETPIVFENNSGERENKEYVPERIRQMKRLYSGNYSYTSRRDKNFYVQGKFMENYEDDAPWEGEISNTLPSYRDFSIKQLRGYFTWRSGIRKGEYKRNAEAFAYIYIFELINGIGVSSPEESVEKMREFSENYIESVLHDTVMERQLREWLFDFAVVNRMDIETIRRYNSSIMKKDEALMVLKSPDKHDNRRIFESMCLFAGEKYLSSPVIKKFGADGERLFAEVWKFASGEVLPNGRNLFNTCFGDLVKRRWFPFLNAVYCPLNQSESQTYVLNECHLFSFQDECWFEESYAKNVSKMRKFAEFMHVADRKLRLYLKAGRQLQEKEEERWADKFIDSAIEADITAKKEAKRAKISINFSNLEKIRSDAFKTRENLLTEDEKEEIPENLCIEAGRHESFIENETSVKTTVSDLPLDETMIEILSALLNGESAAKIIESRHGMAEIYADSINEALFNEIGDNVVECDGSDIVLLEDYRDDVAMMLGLQSKS